MIAPVLVATWDAGLFVVSGEESQQELADHSVSGLATDGLGGALVIVDKRSLRQRAPDGAWTTIATVETDLACCVAVGDFVYAGTEEASILRISADGTIESLPGFAKVKGRDKWHRVGPPLEVRSLAMTSDDAVLLANVHVGGIPRSTDAGATWQPTIDVDSDVHEVRAHPNRPGIAAAAAAIGLCVSRDGGATWEVEHRGFHSCYCSAIEFVEDDILVSASEGPFASRGAIYRRGVDERGPLVRVGDGLPEWFDGRVDTRGIAASGSVAAVADWGGNLYVSDDAGRTWSLRAKGMRGPSGVLIV